MGALVDIVRHYFSVQSNQFCAVEDVVCAVQLDEKLCSPKITITGKVYALIFSL